MDEITAFLAVISTGSFTGAGRLLGRDASIMSRRVSSLEARLGIRLFERSTRKVMPTEAGLRYGERMRAALDDMADAEAEATQASDTASGILRLALPGAFGRLWVAPLLPEFLERHPSLAIDVQYADRYLDLIAERIDLAVRVGSLEDSRLVARQIAPHRRMICAAPSYLARHGHPVSPRDLSQHACLCFSRLASHPDWHFRRSQQMVTVRVGGPLLADDAQSLVQAAVAGAGLVMCSDWLTVKERAGGELVSVLPDWEVDGAGAIHALWPSSRFIPAKTRHFIDWLAERFAAPPWSESEKLRRPRKHRSRK